jgi:hypothetical protein
MRGSTPAILGVLCFVIAGFVRGAGRYSADLALVLAATYALGACVLLGVLTGGVAMGIHLSRE